MLDEETGAEPRVNSASIADPYLLLIRDDSSIYVAQIDDNNELEELEKEDKALVTTKWLTGCLYIDTSGVFADEVTNKGAKAKESILMFILSASGALHVRMAHLIFFRLHADLSDISPTKPNKTNICRRGSLIHPPWPFSGLCC